MKKDEVLETVRKVLSNRSEIAFGYVHGSILRAPEHLQSSAKYNFVTSIEAAIDTANHISATRDLRAPRDYADAFKVLAENGVVDPTFAEELQKMARFRNRLVHLYWDVSLEEIWKLLQTRLGDFEKYVHSVVRYLDYFDAPD